MAAGRPKKYTKKRLEEAINKYFRSISRIVPVRDEFGNSILNDNGVYIMTVDYVIPPSISSMCLYLGIDRSTWNNYSDPELHPELHSVTSTARARIEAYLEQQLLTRDKGLQGIIFNLQNNYGWKQKQEVEIGKETRRTMATEGLSIKEKLALIGAERAALAVAAAGEADEET